MPLYEYQCQKCGKISEFLEGINQEKVRKVCRSCGSAALKRIFSSVKVSSGSARPGSEQCRDICGRARPGTVPPCSGGVCPH